MGRLAKVGHDKLLTMVVWVAPFPGHHFSNRVAARNNSHSHFPGLSFNVDGPYIGCLHQQPSKKGPSAANLLVTRRKRCDPQ